MALLIFQRTIINFIHNLVTNLTVNWQCTGNPLCSNKDNADIYNSVNPLPNNPKKEARYIMDNAGVYGIKNAFDKNKSIFTGITYAEIWIIVIVTVLYGLIQWIQWKQYFNTNSKYEVLAYLRPYLDRFEIFKMKWTYLTDRIPIMTFIYFLKLIMLVTYYGHIPKYIDEYLSLICNNNHTSFINGFLPKTDAISIIKYIVSGIPIFFLLKKNMPRFTEPTIPIACESAINENVKIILKYLTAKNFSNPDSEADLSKRFLYLFGRLISIFPWVFSSYFYNEPLLLTGLGINILGMIDWDKDWGKEKFMGWIWLRDLILFHITLIPAILYIIFGGIIGGISLIICSALQMWHKHITENLKGKWIPGLKIPLNYLVFILLYYIVKHLWISNVCFGNLTCVGYRKVELEKGEYENFIKNIEDQKEEKKNLWHKPGNNLKWWPIYIITVIVVICLVFYIINLRKYVTFGIDNPYNKLVRYIYYQLSNEKTTNNILITNYKNIMKWIGNALNDNKNISMKISSLNPTTDYDLNNEIMSEKLFIDVFTSKTGYIDPTKPTRLVPP